MCLQSDSAHEVLCVPSLDRLQMHYICPKVKEDTVAFAFVLAHWVILLKQKSTTAPTHCHRLKDIMFCMKHENLLHRSRIYKQFIFWEESSPEVIPFSLLDFSFLCFRSFPCMVHYCNLFKDLPPSMAAISHFKNISLHYSTQVWEKSVYVCTWVDSIWSRKRISNTPSEIKLNK